MGDSNRYALFSGGHDSLVSTHKTMESGNAEKVLHIDTGIGIPETREYVGDVCDRHDWPLDVVSSDHDYEQIVKEEGFPGPPVHIIMYSKLKERALRKVARRHDDKPHFYTGVRADESERRFRNLESRVQEDSQWIWYAPIRELSQSDIHDYMESYGLQPSPVKQLYHHSGECLCGAFGNRAEELTLLEAHFPETAERIKELESAVQDIHGHDETSFWAHGSMGTAEIAAKHPDQMMLCRDCEKGWRED